MFTAKEDNVMPMPLFPSAPICNYLLIYVTAFYVSDYDHVNCVLNLNA